MLSYGLAYPISVRRGQESEEEEEERQQSERVNRSRLVIITNSYCVLGTAAPRAYWMSTWRFPELWFPCVVASGCWSLHSPLLCRFATNGQRNFLLTVLVEKGNFLIKWVIICHKFNYGAWDSLFLGSFCPWTSLVKCLIWRRTTVGVINSIIS